MSWPALHVLVTWHFLGFYTMALFAMLFLFLNFLEMKIGSRDSHLLNGVRAHCSEFHPFHYFDSLLPVQSPS